MKDTIKEQSALDTLASLEKRIDDKLQRYTEHARKDVVHSMDLFERLVKAVEKIAKELKVRKEL